jgi:hypothetical protein
MSGMGGLALHARAIQLSLKMIFSWLFINNQRHNLVDRENPKAYYTKLAYGNVLMAEKNNSGMVKDNRIQQWVIRMLTILQKIGRQRLNRCGWVNTMTCLRYSPFLVGNFKVIRQQLDCLYPRHFILLCFELYYFLLVHN